MSHNNVSQKELSKEEFDNQKGTINDSFEDYTRVLYQEIIKLEHDYKTTKLVEFWYTFRLTDPECLEKYPNITTIQHFKIPEMSTAEKSLYEMAKTFFRVFINIPEKERMLRIISNDPSQMHLVIVLFEDRDQVTGFNMSHDDIQIQLNNLGVPEGTYLIVDILGANGCKGK